MANVWGSAEEAADFYFEWPCFDPPIVDSCESREERTAREKADREAAQRAERRIIPDSEYEYRLCMAVAQQDAAKARHYYDTWTWDELVRAYAHQVSLSQ
ncbi:MAG: hypothetical protein ABIR47_07415 [Candidatus Kapaibacterium sp.]